MVQSGFTRKKVESLTLGEKMKKLRNDFRMSLQEVSKATHIQVKYLEYLENGEYEKLPADVYVRGFLRSYARYLNIDENAFIKLYERERNIQENLGKEPKKFEMKSFSPASWVITSRTLIMGGIVLLVGGAFFYLYQEFKSFAAVPRLVILEPSNGATVSTSEVVLKGQTDKGSQVSINNQVVFVGSGGEFSDKLILQPGMNSITVTTTNRFNKVKSESLSLQADYTVTQPQSPAFSLEETFGAEIYTKAVAADVVIVVDGSEVFRGTVVPEEKKVFEVKEKIEVSSNQGDVTFVKLEEQEEVSLATKKGAIEKVVFLKTGRQE